MFNSNNKSLSSRQRWQQQTLKAATYAAFAQTQPVYLLKAMGTQTSAYSFAFVDFLGKPQLVGMDISQWTGGIGERIHILVKDNVMVLHVRVMIREDRLSDIVLESGHAYRSPSDGLVWTYLTKTRIHQKPGFCVDVLATDLPGNLSVETMEFT